MQSTLQGTIQPLPLPTAFRAVFAGHPLAPRPATPFPIPSQRANHPTQTTRGRRRHPEGAPDPAAARKALREAGLHLRRLTFTQGGKVEMYLSAKGAATFGFSHPAADGAFRIPAEVAEACRLTFEQALSGLILAGSARVTGLGRPNANDYLCVQARWKEEAPTLAAPSVRTVPVDWGAPAFRAAFPARG